MKKYGKGWFGESRRHYLASKGVQTNKYYQRTIAGRFVGSTIAQSSAQRKARVRGAGLRSASAARFAEARQAGSPLTVAERQDRDALLKQLRAKATAPTGQEFKRWDPNLSELWESDLQERRQELDDRIIRTNNKVENNQRLLRVIEQELEGSKKGDLETQFKKSDLQSKLDDAKDMKKDLIKKVETLDEERNLNNELRKVGGSLDVDNPPNKFKKLLNNQVKKFGAKQ